MAKEKFEEKEKNVKAKKQDTRAIKLEDNTPIKIESMQKYGEGKAVQENAKNKTIKNVDVPKGAEAREAIVTDAKGRQSVVSLEKLSEEQLNFLNKLLDERGVNVKWIGRPYLISIAELIYFNNGLMLSLNTKVFPLMAELYGSKYVNVEKSVRNAILKSDYAKDHQTTAKTFIMDLVQKLKLFSREK